MFKVKKLVKRKAKKVNKVLSFAFLALLLIIPTSVFAQVGDLNLSFGEDMLSSRHLFQMIALLTVLSLAPSILMMVTSFTRIVVVLSLLRSAMGLQNTPPNTVLISLALFLSLFIMGPTFNEAYKNGIEPYLNEQIDEVEAFDATVEPFSKFMGTQVRESDLDLFLNMIPEEEKPKNMENASDAPLQALVPAFMISELRRAFEIGFLIFLPFLIIDLTVASILMSMGMMMLPPVMLSMPFKIIFFVLIDGWQLLAGSLVESFK
jgi:flagellar biosynthetic protein FliP